MADYYQRLRNRGHTVDPSTGHALYAGAGNITDDTLHVADEQYQADARGIIDSQHMSVEQKSRALSALRNAARPGTPRTMGAVDFFGAQQGFDALLSGAAFQADPATGVPLGPAESPQTRLAKAALPSPQQQAFDEAIAPHAKDFTRQAAADYIAITKAMGAPGVMQSDINNLQAQYQAKYGNVQLPQPMSRAQVASMEKKVKLEEYRDLYEQLGAPRAMVMDIDAKGNVMGPPLTDYWRMVSENIRGEKVANQSERDYNRQLAEDYGRELAKSRDELADVEEQLTAPMHLPGHSEKLKRRLGMLRAKTITFQTLHRESLKKWTGYDPQAVVDILAPPEEPPRTPAEQAMRDRVPYVEIQSVEEITNGLLAGTWKPGTILKFQGYSRRVSPSGHSTTPIQ